MPRVPSEPTNRSEQVVAGGVLRKRDHFAVVEDHGGGEDVGGGRAELEAVGAAGVLRDVAAERAGGLARGIGGEEEPEDAAAREISRLTTPVWQRAQRSAALISSTRFIPAREITTPPSMGVAASGEPGPRAAGGERNPGGGTGPHHRGDLLRRAGQRHRARSAPVGGAAVALVGQW